MPWSVDARIPVSLGGVPEQGDAVLCEGGAALDVLGERFEVSAGHAAGCSCCLPRTAAAAALDRLFQRRARGEVPFFRRVVALTTTPKGDTAVCTAIRNDPMASARFRLEI